MTNEDFKSHLQTMVDGRMAILNDSTLNDDDKKIALSIYDKENDELNQSIDIFFRLEDYEGFLQYSNLMQDKVNTEQLEDALQLKADKTALETKADSESVNTALATKADITALEAKISFDFDSFTSLTFVQEPVNFTTTIDSDTSNLLVYSFSFDLPKNSFISYSSSGILKHTHVYSRISFLVDDVEDAILRIPRINNDYTPLKFSEFLYLSKGSHTFKILFNVQYAEDVPGLLLDVWDLSVKLKIYPLLD